MKYITTARAIRGEALEEAAGGSSVAAVSVKVRVRLPWVVVVLVGLAPDLLPEVSISTHRRKLMRNVEYTLLTYNDY